MTSVFMPKASLEPSSIAVSLDSFVELTLHVLDFVKELESFCSKEVAMQLILGCRTEHITLKEAVAIEWSFACPPTSFCCAGL
jgi:hypothetical protein